MDLNYYPSPSEMSNRAPVLGASSHLLLATKFLLPEPPHELVGRPHLLDLLDAGLHRRLVLVSAAAGFGKTTLLASWIRSFASGHPPAAWITLDASDNAPVQFWSYVLTALEQCHPGISQLPFAALHDTPHPSWQSMLTALINGLAQLRGPLVLVLDNYEKITEPAIHALLASLIEHAPPTLCVVIATRIDPPFSLVRLRAQAQIQELRSEHLRATWQEMTAFLREVMGLRITEQDIQAVNTRLHGWWVSLQLAALALQGEATPTNLLQALEGNQQALFAYLVQEVLNSQPEHVQNFLLRTSILPSLSGSLCNAVLEQQDSQLLLEEVEKANLFLCPLDEQHEWYVYHPLFAEALHAQLEQRFPTEVPGLHLRASQWCAANQERNSAIQHALAAHAFPWAATLMEQVPAQRIWSRQESGLLSSWIEQLPREAVRERPRLCLAYAQSLLWVAPPEITERWVTDARSAWAQAHLRETQTGIAKGEYEPEAPTSLLGEIAALQATLAGFYDGDAGATRALCREALTHLDKRQWRAQFQVAFAQARANVAQDHFEQGMQQMHIEWSQIKAEEDQVCESLYWCEATWETLISGKLHQAWQCSQKATHALQKLEGHQPALLGWPYMYQAMILHEWNCLEEAHSLAEQAIQFGEQTEYMAFLPLGYLLLLRIALSRGKLEEAQKASQQLEYVWRIFRSPYRSALWSSVDQMRCWLACGDPGRAQQWAKEVRQGESLASPLAREKLSIASIRLLLAEAQPDHALKLLAPLIERAAAARRWNDVLEMWLLQAQAYQMLRRQHEALSLVEQAAHLAAPEGYIRRFVDEGAPIVELLARSLEQKHLQENSSYLETLVRVFNEKPESQPIGVTRDPSAKPNSPLLDPLSAREQEVLLLLARGASNQDIAGTLVMAIDTVKHHVSNILSKLDVTNRTQAVVRAQALGLLPENT